MPATKFAEVWKDLDEIHNALTDSNESMGVRSLLWDRPEWPYWYVDLLTQIYVLTSGSPIEYITSSVTDSRIEGDDVYAFTSELVIHASVAGLEDSAQGQEASVRTTAWSRAELTNLTITRLAAYTTRLTADEVKFPQRLRLELSYANRPTITLPLPPVVGNESLEAAYPSLLADLTSLSK